MQSSLKNICKSLKFFNEFNQNAKAFGSREENLNEVRILTAETSGKTVH